MRFASLLLLAALGACYSPAGEATCKVECSGPDSPCPGAMRCGDYNFCEKPGGETCGPGGEIIDAFVPDPDAQGDAPVDGLVSGPCLVASTMISDDSIAPVGAWFVGDHFSQRAMMIGASNLMSYEGNFDVSGATYARPVIEPVGTEYRAPRLSPGGSEMYLKADVSGTISFGLSTRTGPNAWSLHSNVVFKNGAQFIQFSDADNISPPTLTNPRRLVVSSSNGFQEFTETNPLLWKLALTVSTPILGGVSFLGQASLSPEGLKLVFQGQGAGLISAYYVTRPDVTQNFSGPAIEIPHNMQSSVYTPFLSANCKHFYYTSNMGDVRHVLLP